MNYGLLTYSYDGKYYKALQSFCKNLRLLTRDYLAEPPSAEGGGFAAGKDGGSLTHIL